MKASPLCTRDDGREVMFTIRHPAAKLRVIFTKELLEDACGNDASFEARKRWAETQKTALLDRLSASDTVPVPPNGILIEEVN